MNEYEECFGAEISGVKMKRNKPNNRLFKIVYKIL